MVSLTLKQFPAYCHMSWWLKMGVGLVIGFINHLRIVTTINYYTIADFHPTIHSNLIFSVYLRYFSRIYNTETIKVSLNHTLPISLCYSTYKVFKSHVKSSQTDFLYSSVLLQLTACVLCFSSLLPHSGRLLLSWVWIWVSCYDRRSAGQSVWSWVLCYDRRSAGQSVLK
jgi:hypothetical protein